MQGPSGRKTSSQERKAETSDFVKCQKTFFDMQQAQRGSEEEKYFSLTMRHSRDATTVISMQSDLGTGRLTIYANDTSHTHRLGADYRKAVS